MKPTDPVWVAGHQGLVGSAIVRRLAADGFSNVITTTHKQVDLEDRSQVDAFVGHSRPKYVFLAAAKVGGILANNTYPADFIRTNLAIALNVIDASHHAGVEKLLFLGSSCIYPKYAPQPMREEYLLTGPLEPTNQPYAIAKIAGLELCRSYRRQHGDRFIACMPTNLYGPGDNFDLGTSHVLPALIRRFYEAKVQNDPAVTLWGTGTPRREFLHVDDLADACVHLMSVYEADDAINIGTGVDLSIAELARLVAQVAAYQGAIVWDDSKPDGTPRKLLDVTRMKALGWSARISLEDGIRSTYRWYTDHLAALTT